MRPIDRTRRCIAIRCRGLTKLKIMCNLALDSGGLTSVSAGVFAGLLLPVWRVLVCVRLCVSLLLPISGGNYLSMPLWSIIFARLCGSQTSRAARRIIAGLAAPRVPLPLRPRFRRLPPALVLRGESIFTVGFCKQKLTVNID